jgi:hypothetical protein
MIPHRSDDGWRLGIPVIIGARGVHFFQSAFSRNGILFAAHAVGYCLLHAVNMYDWIALKLALCCSVAFWIIAFVAVVNGTMVMTIPDGPINRSLHHSTNKQSENFRFCMHIVMLFGQHV